MRVTDSGGRAWPFGDAGSLTLEEDREYRVAAETDIGEAWFDDRRLPLGTDGCARLVVSRWVSARPLVLRLLVAGDWRRVPVHVRPRREKLSLRTWEAMLDDLEAWLPTASAGLAGGVSGGVADGGHPATWMAVALAPLVSDLHRALEALLHRPRHDGRELEVDVPLRRLRRVDGATVRRLGGDPALRAALDPWGPGPGPDRVYVTTQLIEEDVDHPANRFTAWTLARVLRRIREAEEQLRAAAAHPEAAVDASAWCLARADVFHEGWRGLERLRSSSFLARFAAAAEPPPLAAALPVIFDDPVYARFHRVARRFLSPRFSTEAAAVPVPQRPSHDLYELWAFLALGRRLEARWPTWRWRSAGFRQLLDLSGNGAGARFMAQEPRGGRLDVRFNLTFPSILDGQRSRYSLTRRRRPDIVVTWAPAEGDGRWLCLDAKYRASRAALAESFESAHIYRDSLRWPRLGGASRGCLLLTPAQQPACEAWYAAEFRTRHGFGAVRWAPGEPAEELIAWMVDALGIDAASV